MKTPSFYEQTDPDLSEKPRQAAKRSVSNVSAFNPPPSQPPPRLSSTSGSTSPRSKRRLSAEPEFPPISAGGSNENLSLPSQGDERRSRDSSRQSSVNRLSGVSEDNDELSNYEPIDTFLVEKRQTESKVPAPQRSTEGSPLRRRSSKAPHYPAPLPPNKQTKAAATKEEDDDSDGYEPVQLAGQDSENESERYRDEVERAVLPLKPGAVRVGAGRERSPTVSSFRTSSESPPRSVTNYSSSLPAGTSHLLRPPLKEKSASPPKWADTKSGKVLIPPEPSSPPPSPPGGPNIALPPAYEQRVLSQSSNTSAEQPSLPPKKKSARNPTYESRPLQSQTTTSEGFGALNPPGGDVLKSEGGLAVTSDEVYFDHLASGPPPLPKKPPQIGFTSQTSQPSTQPEEDDTYFDHLPAPPSIPSKTSQTSTQPTEDDVYFDHLVTGPPAVPGKTSLASVPTTQPQDDVYFDHLVTGPPTIPSKTNVASVPTTQLQDDVYFDHLVTGPPEIPGKTGSVSMPTNQAPDDVYFDHLTGPVVPDKPVQPAPGPRLPPKRQPSIPEGKPSEGVKKPVSSSIEKVT